MIGLDITRRFNQMPPNVKLALTRVLSAYDKGQTYKYDQSGLAGLIGESLAEAIPTIRELVDYGFIIKSGISFKLNRQRADTLITLGILDLDESTKDLKPMGPVNEDPDEDIMENKIISEQGFVSNNVYTGNNAYTGKFSPISKKGEMYTRSDLENYTGYAAEKKKLEAQPEKEKDKDPTKLSHDGFKITHDSLEKHTRYRVIEIIDQSLAGRKIDTPLWAIADTETNILYLIAQEGLRFKDPDRSIFIGLKQLEFIKNNPNYILGKFLNTEKGIEKARKLASKFFDLALNGRSMAGYIPKRVGNKFWVLQSAKDGMYIVLKKGLLPEFTHSDRKIEKLSHDEAVGVFAASERKAKDDQDGYPDKDAKEEKFDLSIHNYTDFGFGSKLEPTINNLDNTLDNTSSQQPLKGPSLSD